MSVVVLDAVRRQYARDPGVAATPAPCGASDGPSAPWRGELRRLSLVPDLPRSGRPVLGGGGARRPHEEPPLRLTAFGRLVVAVLVAGVVSLLAVGLAGQLASAQEQPRDLTVRWGQTLSGIAAEHLPEMPVREGVVRLQLANGLSSTEIHAGQHLVVPAP